MGPLGGAAQGAAVFVSLSVTLSVATNSTSEYLWFQMRYHSEIFWRHSCDVPTLVPNNSKILYVCQSVYCLTSLLKLGYYWISLVQVELSFSNFLETFLGYLYTNST